jgi:hypothetical protein
MARYNILFEKTLNFAARIVTLYKHLIQTQKEYDLPRQILRSGTSIGANAMDSDLQEIIKILVSIIKKTKESAGSLNSGPAGSLNS